MFRTDSTRSGFGRGVVVSAQHPLLVKGRVVHVRYRSSGELLFHPTGMGVEFTSLDPEDKERLQAFLKEIADRFEI